MKDKTTHIHVLADHVINKIAAGEVVERPASVVKELMENALDARAGNVDVEITAGGKRLIAVSDNGLGMDRNDALLSIERHATSKINDVDDIEKIATLGFRGEALAAISSVSRFTLRTRRADSLAGTELVMAGGKMQDVREVGCPPGTLVGVRHLFFNVPARRKFLRTEQTEEAHIRQVFMMYALSNPKVGLRLKADNRLVYNLPANATVENRLGDIFVSISKNDLRPVAWSAPGTRISGYAALPSLTRADRSEQYLFINRRPASAALLVGAIREGYQGLIPKNRYPVIFLFLEINPDLVDVNVHPAKKEVRFRNPGEIRNAVAMAIREALKNPGFVRPFPVPFAFASPSGGRTAPGLSAAGGDGREIRPSGTIDYARPRKHKPGGVAPAASVLPLAGHFAPAANEGTGSEEENQRKPWAWRRVVGQIANLYVLMETEDGLVLMDPHAAHERVLFEKFMAEAAQNAVKSQTLLMAESVVLSPPDAVCIRRAITALRKIGFGIAEFGPDTFLVDALPACFGNVAARSLLMEIASALHELSGRSAGEDALKELIARSACHAAVKAHSRLSESEIERLISELEKAEMPYTCPHGRPVIIHFSFQDLARKFGRNAPRGESG
ncbi:MAG: DNA mismatch repair endonuclease MutL [Kiritimatiellae bacterium]|nr:DNA mismatch repair endonuclease MutL [Kiritimatiellia bacterium]